MTSPGQIEITPGELWAHGTRSQNRSTDYHTNDHGVEDDGWPSQRAYGDARKSAAGAGKAFGDRQEDRGQAVGAAADGFSGQDFDASKLMQGIGAIMGPIMQAVQGLVTGLVQGGTQALSAGATSLSGMFTSGATMLSQGLPKGPQTDVLASAKGGGGLAAGLGGGGPVGGGGAAPSPTGAVGHSSPDKGGRPEGRGGELKLEPAVALGGMGSGMGGIPRGREEGRGSDKKPEIHPIDAPEVEPVLEPVSVKADVRST